MNTAVTNCLNPFQVRDFYVFPELEKIIDEKFPDDKPRPTLQELESQTGLVLQV
jgi:hypothetical protein